MREGNIAKVVVFKQADGSHKCLLTYRWGGVWRKALRQGPRGQAVSTTILDFASDVSSSLETEPAP